MVLDITIMQLNPTMTVLTFLQVTDTTEVDWLIWDYKMGQSYHQTPE